MSATIESLLQLDAAVERAGHFALSLWWRAEAERFLTHPTARTFAARVGRGGCKSSSAVKLAINEVLLGDFVVPPGERHYFAFVSINRDEASQRLRLIESCLKALGVAYTRTAETIDLVGVPRGWKVFASAVGSVSGFRCLGFAADELAKYASDDGTDPAREVVASLRAMTVTHPNARALLFSSPLSVSDFHYEVVELGDTDRQVVSIAPSWVANPSITEEQTHRLEPDARIWAREYAAVPQAAALAAFDIAAVARAFEPRSSAGYVAGTPIVVVDPSSGRSDAWAWAVCRWFVNSEGPCELDRHGSPMRYPSGAPIPNLGYVERRPILAVQSVDAVEGAFWEQTSAADIVRRVATLARSAGASVVVGDQREAFALQSAFAAEGLRYVTHAWSNTSKVVACERIRRWLAESTLALPAHPRMLAELLSFEEKITPNGSLTFAGRGSTHDDFVALLLTLAMADSAGDLNSTPYKPRTPRGMGSLAKLGLC